MKNWCLCLLGGAVAMALAGCGDPQGQADQDLEAPVETTDAGDDETSLTDPIAEGDLAAITGPVGSVRRIGDSLAAFKAAFVMPAGATALPRTGYSQLGLDEWGWELEGRQYVSVGYEGDEVWFVEWWRNDLDRTGIDRVVAEEQSRNGDASFVTNAASGTGRTWSGDEASRLLVAWTDDPYGCTIIVARNSEFAVLNYRQDYLTNMVRMMDMLDAPPPGMYASGGR